MRGRRVGQRDDDDELLGVGDDRPLDRVGVVRGAAQQGPPFGDGDDAGERVGAAGGVAGELDPVADDHRGPPDVAAPDGR